ncbi:hypothetical protein DM860_017555 [Cuscuta australis]|uniref:DUF4283 domain-containing protein n=1 Tax=Cuscuta australis TaxID=267555 RepID=A0A328DU77_9ASTE|nr:hypothetical protein DM860_017555 [Cuscuta australis]
MADKPKGELDPPTKSYADVVGCSDKVQTNLTFYQYEELNGQKVARITKEDVLDNAGIWDRAVLCCILGANPPVEVVKGFLSRIWKNYAIEDVSFFKNGQYIALFEKEEDRDEAVKRKYYHFDNKPMLVQRWRPGSTISVMESEDIPIWIQLPNLDLKYWSLSGLGRLGRSLGNQLKEILPQLLE